MVTSIRMHHKPKCKMYNHKTSRGKKKTTGENLCDIGLGKDFFRYDTKNIIHKGKKNGQIGRAQN